MIYLFGPFRLDAARRLLYRGDERVTITPKALELLAVLLGHPGETVGKETLMRSVWPDTFVEESNLTFNVSAIRKALGESSAEQRFIVTVPGQGYRFVGEVRSGSEEVVVVKRSRETITVEEHEPTMRRSHWLIAAIVAASAVAILLGLVLRSRSHSAPQEIRTIAVLPFRPIDGVRDPSLEIGMAQSVIARLSVIRGLVVRPVSSVMNLASQDPIDSGRRLGVDAVVDATMQRSDTRMRVSARLLRSSDGRAVWSETIETPLAGLFEMQDQVAERVAAAVATGLTSDDRTRLRRRATASPEAWREYVRGRYLLNRGERSEAIASFERATAIDPGYAEAWAGLADAWSSVGRYLDRSPREEFEKATAAAERALALDPTLAEAHAARGEIAFGWDWDPERAEAEYRRAVELDPQNPETRHRLSFLLAHQGNSGEALQEIAIARKLDPLTPSYLMTEALVQRFAGRPDRALEALEEVRVLAGMSPPIAIHSALALIEQGKAQKAFELLESVQARTSHPQLVSILAYAAARAGHEADARALLSELEQRDESGKAVPWANLASVYAALEQPDDAFRCLDRALAERSWLLTLVTVDPRFDPLRKDSRFPRFAERLREGPNAAEPIGRR